jgi:uncharacterized membrane protein SpoIIM required for sporulation
MFVLSIHIQMKYRILFFYLCMPSDIFLFPAIWLAAAAGSFLRYLDRGPKELFFREKPRSNCKDNFQIQNTTQKV